MYLHIGGRNIIPLKDIITITKLSNCKSRINKELLALSQADKKVVNLCENKPKSCIITDDKIYLSSVSVTTLIKRTNTAKVGL